MSDERLDELRRRVLEADRRIVASVNERVRLVDEIWALKDARGLALLDSARERALHEALAAGSEGPLSREGLDSLIDSILELTKREVERARAARG